MKAILLPIHDDEGQAARIAAAVAVARALGGELLCLDVVALPHAFLDYFSQAGRAMFERDEEWRARSNRDRLQRQLDRENVPYRWTETRGDPDACVAAAADLADIVILSRRGGFRPIVLRAALKRKPILSMPPGLLDFDPAGRAIVAWDGSTAATAMLRACVPLLQQAAAVELFSVTAAGRAVPAVEAAQYLSRHGIHARIASQLSGLHAAAEWLHDRCAATKAAYCVMGAFGDHHLRDYLFGGTTRRMLATDDLPIVFGG